MKIKYKEFTNITETRIGSEGLTDNNFNTFGLLEDDIHPVVYFDEIVIDGSKTYSVSQVITNGLH